MAKLSFGSMAIEVSPRQVESNLPSLELQQQVTTQIKTEPDLTELVQKVIDRMPKPTEPTIQEVEKVDLTPIHNKVDKHYNQFCNEIDNLKRKLENSIVIPEVKEITHIKDVSKEVLNQVSESIKATELSLMLKINDLNKKNKAQRVINIVLTSLLVLTILLHFK